VSRRANPLSRLRRQADEGFSLVEILVSITILGIVAAGVLPLLLSSIQAATLAKLNTQAKGVAQERLERMRNLPFHIAHVNGNYIDVLDIYFKDLRNPGTVGTGDSCASRRYDAATLSSICAIATTTVGAARFDQSIATKFVTSTGAAVTPRSTYDSQVTNLDAPASGLLDVIITTTWTQAAKSKTFVLRSRVVSSSTDEPLIRSKMQASALKVTGGTATGDVLQFEAGVISAEGSKATATSASGTAVGAYGSLQSGRQAQGANVTLSAPLDDVRTGLGSVDTKDLGTLTNASAGGCALVCFGRTRIDGQAAALTSGGMPKVGVTSGGTGYEAELVRTGSGPDKGFQYNNATLAEAAAALGVSSLPLVGSGGGADQEIITSSGWVTASDSTPTSVSSHVQSATQLIKLFPTTYASEGVVQLTLNSASLTCKDSDAAGVTADWLATVSVWRHSGTTSGYQTYVIKPGGTDTLPSPTSVTVAPGVLLSSFVTAWEGLTAAASTVALPGTASRSATIPSVVSILTAPTRLNDASSVLNIALGSLSCYAEDNQ
jgi:prepilin-type N-terminal cleavage/methylation domain-containing protein